MKQLLLFLIGTIVFGEALTQTGSTRMFRQADSFYSAKDYSTAATFYSEGIKRNPNVAPARYYSAASAWTLANNSDSAFKFLEQISQNEKLTSTDYNNLMSRKEVDTWQKDKRWKTIVSNFKLKSAANSFPQNEIIYGYKDGMGLVMTQVKPRENSNGKAVIRVLAGSWFSSPTWAAPSIFYARRYLEKGYTVFMVALGSQPRFAIPDQVEDLKRAVRYIRYHAKDLDIDPNKIGIEGGSAGGHLSLCIATANDDIKADAEDPVDRVSAKVQAAAVLFPPTDFMNWGGPGVAVINVRDLQKVNRVYGAFDFRVWNSNTSTYDPVTDTSDRNKIGREISPIYAVSADDPPIFIIHGDADPTVPLQQSKIFVDQLIKTGVKNKFIVKKGARHSEDDLIPEVLEFADWFDKYLK